MAFRDSKAKCIITITAIYLFAGTVGMMLSRYLTFDYWLNLLKDTDSIDESSFRDLYNQCMELRRMLVSSINTMKSKE